MAKQYSLFNEKKPITAPIMLQLAAHTTPDFLEVRGKDYIKFGKKNNYPNYLIDLYNKSAKHGAIINSKVNYTSGNGWEFANANEIDEKLKAFMDFINVDGENLNELTTKVNIDLELFGGFYLEVIGNKSGRGISSIKHIDFSKVRSNKDNSEFYYTAGWLDYKGNENRVPEENEDWAVFKPFNPENLKGATIFYYKSYRPNMDVYALPQYTQAIEYIEIDTLIASHHYNNIKNGFVGNVMISFLNGQPSVEEQEIIERKIQEKFTGSEGQRLIINFADGADSAAKIDFLTQPDVYKTLTDLSKQVEQEILTGHQLVSGMLVGIKTEGQLGGRDEMVDAYELMKNTYIKPKQAILERVFNYLLHFNSVVDIVLKQAEPIAVQFSEDMLKSIMTTDELREKIGLPPMAKDALTPSTEARFSSEDKLKIALKAFDKYGENKKDYTILKQRFVSFNTNLGAVESELNYYQTFDTYTSLERSILDLLAKDELLDSKGLAVALKVDEPKVQKAIDGLVKSGDLKLKTATSGGDKIPKYKVTTSGTQVVEEQGARTEDIYIKYSYEVISGMGAPIIPTTRPFCEELIKKDKLYSREEIENISSEAGYNVFEMRGGWYTQKNGVAVPHCRHQWQQNIVKKK